MVRISQLTVLLLGVVDDTLNHMKISLIIAVYQRDDFLRLVLESIGRQSFRDFEVIVAEDGCSRKVAAVVDTFKRACGIPLRHFTQEDVGFRKAGILNNSVVNASGEFLVFIDGDCVLHRHFLREYAKRAHDELCLFGRRVMLDRNTTEILIKEREAYEIGPLRVLLSRSRKKEEALYFPLLTPHRKKGVNGCSFCVSRRKMLAINGFDEDFTEPYYGEDTDIERRLKLLGLRFVCTRYATIQYHLYHNAGDRSFSWMASEKLYLKKSKEKSPWCANGIVKAECF